MATSLIIIRVAMMSLQDLAVCISLSKKKFDNKVAFFVMIDMHLEYPQHD